MTTGDKRHRDERTDERRLNVHFNSCLKSGYLEGFLFFLIQNSHQKTADGTSFTRGATDHKCLVQIINHIKVFEALSGYFFSRKDKSGWRDV